jgi:hypothetical protein
MPVLMTLVSSAWCGNKKKEDRKLVLDGYLQTMISGLKMMPIHQDSGEFWQVTHRERVV